MRMNLINFNKLDLPEILRKAAELPKIGKLDSTFDNLTFLNIEDDYILQLYPLLSAAKPEINIPDYFGVNLIGAHISVIYPEENKIVAVNDLGKTHSFEISGVFYGDIGLKRYYVLGIISPSLISLRNKYGLSEKLLFKEQLVDLHITIGTNII